MPRSKAPRWSVNDVSDRLRAVPAPLQSDADRDAFHEAVSMVQSAPTAADRGKIVDVVTKEIIRVVDATVKAKNSKRSEDQVLFGLKMLAYMPTKASVEFIARVAASGYQPDAYLWSVVLYPFGEGHPGAAALFKALSKPLPDKFLGVCLLDAANSAARDHKLKAHPFDSSAGVSKLAEILSRRKPSQSSYAVSACAALPFLSGSRRKKLIALAREYKHPAIQMEVAWAAAMMGDKKGVAFLVDRCLDRNFSLQACHYLEEAGQKKLIPRAARDPDFVAMAEMCQWLSHPNEFGEAPHAIEQMDKRAIYWPPTRDSREVHLFSYTYNKGRFRSEPVRGVGMVGSMTWSFFEETNPEMSPEDIYGLHCCFELQANGDRRAPAKRSGKKGWAMIQAKGR